MDAEGQRRGQEKGPMGRMGLVVPMGPMGLSIDAFLCVEKESQKGMLIGKGAAVVKRIRTEAERELDGEVLQIVVPGAVHHQPFAVADPSNAWLLDPHLAAEVFAGQRRRLPLHVDQRSGNDDLAPRAPGAGPQIDDVIRAADGLLIVLDHDDGVPEIP